MANNALSLLKSAKETAVKNRAAAIQKASKVFDEEIAAFDVAIRQLSGFPAKKAPPKKVAKKIASKKAAQKKVAPKKAAKKAAAPKKAAPKKAATKKVTKKATKKTAKKTALKKSPTVYDSGTYPKNATNLQKLVFLIGQAKRFLSMQEIAAMAKKHDTSAGALGDISKRFSKHMHKFRNQGDIVSYQESNKVYYGLPAYMKEGKAVKGHEHVAAPPEK